LPFDQTKNASLLGVLRRSASLQVQETLYAADGYELHAHPDLVDRLKHLINYAENASFQFAFGVPVLYAPNGLIFATVEGTSSLQLYLPGEHGWGRPYAEYGDSWRQGRAWAATAPHEEEVIASFVRLASSIVTAAGKH
jgi:hypothetical protein